VSIFRKKNNIFLASENFAVGEEQLKGFRIFHSGLIEAKYIFLVNKVPSLSVAGELLEDELSGIRRW